MKSRHRAGAPAWDPACVLIYRYFRARNARAAPTAMPRASRAISLATRWRFTYLLLSRAGRGFRQGYPGPVCHRNSSRLRLLAGVAHVLVGTPSHERGPSLLTKAATHSWSHAEREVSYVGLQMFLRNHQLCFKAIPVCWDQTMPTIRGATYHD